MAVLVIDRIIIIIIDRERSIMSLLEDACFIRQPTFCRENEWEGCK